MVKCQRCLKEMSSHEIDEMNKVHCTLIEGILCWTCYMQGRTDLDRKGRSSKIDKYPTRSGRLKFY